MPFIAIRKATGERIDITTIENPRAVLKSGECLCQLCCAPMILKAGLVRQHHFAHAGRCIDAYQSHPESPAHQDAKRYLATHLREWFNRVRQHYYRVRSPQMRASMTGFTAMMWSKH
jgi:competence CoiA-like predicted nuclease